MEGVDVSCEGFVGYDPSLKTVVVSVQGTKPSAMWVVGLSNRDPCVLIAVC